MARLVVLGAGSIVPTENRFGSGLLLETSTTKILFDPGPSTIQRLKKAGVNHEQLDAVIVTHFHLDHVSDLPALIMLWPYNVDGTPTTSPKPLHLIGPKGLSKLVQQTTETHQYLVTTMGCNRYLIVDEMRGGEKRLLKDVTITAVEVEHFNGLAYRIDFGGRSVVVSGDTVPDERLVDLAKGCDVLVHECSFPHDKLVGKHTSEKQLGEIAARVMPKKLVVTHLYPAWMGREHELVEAVRQSGVHQVVVAEDLTVLEI
ncbi:MAG: MBL fold metallo-hydrolase [Candidatus Caldarchaeum sp.]|nr:MBL fold metallo-hydrolase [Candidatus Caldarchaeum sp.]